VIRVYGSRISYYAGKLEAYLRHRGIEYQLLSMMDHAQEILAGAGAVQSPVVRLEDGRWMSDTTPILAWFEAQHQGASIYPESPGMRFLALLLEDHADEWLWRPAMHYRWSYRQDREHASGVLADELLSGVWWPRFAKRWGVARRQFGGFVTRDGVNTATREHVERTAMAAFDGLEAILAERPFLLGERPTVADFGFVGPMFRHFAQDPTPAELMRQRAPRVYTWVARMWEASPVTPARGLRDSPGAAPREREGPRRGRQPLCTGRAGMSVRTFARFSLPRLVSREPPPSLASTRRDNKAGSSRPSPGTWCGGALGPRADRPVRIRSREPGAVQPRNQRLWDWPPALD
jgi:glutathione S-transferase